MDTTQYELDLEQLKINVVRIAKEAADMVRHSDFTVESKETAVNIVTSNDLKVQHFLVEKLSQLFPIAGFYCEEEDLQQKSEYVWVIDPIDGTTNYSRMIDNCAISIALIHNGNVILGVVNSIFSENVYTAIIGKGATLNDKPIAVSNRPFQSAILCSAMSLYKKELAQVCSSIIYDIYTECNDIRRFGSCALELCYLAAGQCELYFEIRVFPWDYAAAYLILKEAGGIICGPYDNEVSFTSPSVIVAANNIENYNKISLIVNKHLRDIGYKN